MSDMVEQAHDHVTQARALLAEVTKLDVESKRQAEAEREQARQTPPLESQNGTAR
jgi:F0F1-type ATP synthase membrane subunit b/b'